MFQFKRTAVVAVAAVLALSGCAAGGGADDGGGAGEAGRGDTLTWAQILPPRTLAQKDFAWANEAPYAQAIYDTLLTVTPEFEVEPNVATEWEYNADNTVLTLTLRDDVTFTNGEALTAEDAAASLMAFKGGSAPQASLIRSISGVEAVDATTLEITLSEPDPGLLTYLAQSPGLLAPAELVEDPSMASEPVGSGPYVLNTAETVVGSSYVFDRNEDYWNPDAQHYEKLILQVYTDPTSLLNAVQGGQVNVAAVSDPTAIPQMEGAGFTANEFLLNWNGFLIMDRAGSVVPALGEVEVRQAINYALDREALLQTIGAGYGEVTAQIFAPFSPGYVEELDTYYEYDLDRAKELMADAGYEDGFELTMPRTTLVPASTYTLMADQLAQIGITVNWEDIQANEVISKVVAGDYPMTNFTLQMGPTDWQLAQFQLAENAAWNPLRYTVPEVEGLIDVIQTGTEDEAAEAAQELNRYVVENAWNAPFFRPTQFFMSDANTQVETQVGNAVPYLSNVQPK